MIVKCVDCPTMFDPRPSGRGPARKRCPEHRDLRKKELARARDALLRAEEWGVPAELVFASDVFERDRWICHICNQVIPPELRTVRELGGKYEPLAPVVDHEKPLSKGGTHTLDNCRAAHWSCNARKYNAEQYSPPAVEADKPVADLESVEASIPSLASTAPKTTTRGRPRLNAGQCAVEECIRPAKTARLCQPHYYRQKTFGDPLKQVCGCGCGELVRVAPSHKGLFYVPGHGVQTNVTSPAEKLRAGVALRPVSEHGRERHGLTDDCQIWTGPKSPQGYGRAYIAVPGQKRKGKSVQTHRLAYALVHGEESVLGLTVDHLCVVPLCCNPNHLEAVTIAENLRRAGEMVRACPAGHPYDEDNTYYGLDEHRRCHQCNTDRYHLEVHGHSFVPDPTNQSSKRRRCLVCRELSESKPAFCPAGHEYTAENKALDSKGKRVCLRCRLSRTHLPQYGHEFVPDPDNPSPKRRRCLTCRENAPAVTHCVNGHEFTEATTKYRSNGQRNCVICRLNAKHVPKHNHEYVIDLDNPTTQRRCLTCRFAKESVPQFCPAGHEFSPDNTYYKDGGRNCRECGRNRDHWNRHGHEFVRDPASEPTGKRVCLTCKERRSRAEPTI
ncbi:HNH endonuclease [Rhodococcus oryzae]|uniref:HNH endonuclease n=1 Tax=Rhodococcus oryzae TaxID=2571143 RepID=UPI0037BB629B